jgi:hypothetical protein
VVNTTFTITGAITNVSVAPTLQYEDIIGGVAGTWTALPTGNTVTTTTFTFTHPAVAAAATSFSVAVRDSVNTGITATSNTFAINTTTGAPGQPTLAPVAVTGTSITFSIAPPTTGGIIDNGGYQPQFGTTSFTNSTFIPWITPGLGSFAALGGTWSISAAGVIAFTGTGGPGISANVTQMTLVNGVVWQFNGTSWFSTTTPGTWAGPTPTSPLATGVTITGLPSGTVENVRAFASNTSGNGPTSAPIQMTTSGGAPPSLSLCWGCNTAGNDVLAMCNTVGGAINAVNNGMVIFCPGPVNGSPGTTLLSGTTKPTGCGTLPDLSAAALHPVTGVPTNKVAYSVQLFPQSISGTGCVDNGASYVTALNAYFGSLTTSAAAYVMITGLGASADNSNDNQTDENVWGAALTAYMNGLVSGGPSFTTSQEQMAGNWVEWCYPSTACSGQQPDGMLGSDNSTLSAPSEAGAFQPVKVRRG